MKKILAIVMMVVLCMSMIPMAVSAAEANYTRGNWTVDGKNYSFPNTDFGNDFAPYHLGNSAKVTITATFKVGGEQGFMFGMKNNNDSAEINEGGDQYYLIDLRNDGWIGIERNDGGWGGWAAETKIANTGDTVTLTAIYDSGKIVVKNGDKVVLAYTDPNPMPGTGYGVCAKKCDATITNVSVANSSMDWATVGTTAGANGGDWTADGSKYVANTRVAWPDFAGYTLGQSSNKTVVLSATVKVGNSNNEEMQNGGDIGFIFGASDHNGNNAINEFGDWYYLVALTGTNDGPTVSIERNHGNWGGWSVRRWDLGLYEGDVVDLVAAYEPAAGKITVWANGYKVAEYTDNNPLPGTGYGLASKQTNGTFENVKVSNTVPATCKDYMEISTADELIALAEAANKWNYNENGGEEHGANFMFGMTVKITADIDMTGKDWTPIKLMKFGIDGQGHTISGLNVDAGEVGAGAYGLIAKRLGNNNFNGNIQNLTIKDSTLTVKSTATALPTDPFGCSDGVTVGTVVGGGDRGYVNNIKLDNVTVNVDGIAYVGGIIGARVWGAGLEENNGTGSFDFAYTSINAPDATVGIVMGSARECKAGDVKNVTGKVYIQSANEVSVIADNACEKVIDAETITVELLSAPQEKPVTPPSPVPTGSPVIGLTVLAAVALAGVAVFSKKRYN